jgi:tetratricopeptide (TPR) repeat protein
MSKNRLNQLLALLEESPSDSFILFALAKEYEKLADLDQALAYYLKLLKEDAAYIGTYYHLGKLYEKLEAAEQALDIYEKGITLAKQIQDQHALSELMNVKLNLELELD